MQGALLLVLLLRFLCKCGNLFRCRGDDAPRCCFLLVEGCERGPILFTTLAVLVDAVGALLQLDKLALLGFQ